MMEKTNQAWYVTLRGELLAEQFLLDLKPDKLSSMKEADIGFDYMACFAKADGSLIAIAIEVKLTEQEINYFRLPASLVKRLQNSNIPVLVVVVDVKHNEIFFNWIHAAVSVKSKHSSLTCSINLRRATPEELEKLKQEILEK